MERYSTLYGAHTFVNADGKEVNQYVEVGRSAGLDEFLKGKKIPNPAMAVADVNNTLTGFVKLPGYDDQPAYHRPMLVRYAPMHLKRLKTYDNTVVSFNAIACSAPDHQVGNRDGKYRNTHFIDRALLLKAGEYNYLDQIFGTHLVNWKENRDVRISPIDYDAPPQKIQLPQTGTDAMLVQIAAAALINKASVVLKLESGCIFQLRSMELLEQIYGLFAPIQAAEIGFASYEDPSRITDLIAKTSIRLFVVPAEADLGSLAKQPGMLVLDLNGEIAKPKGNDLLKAVSLWYSTPWTERASAMSVLFADLYDPNDAQTYVDLTRKYKDASVAAEKKLKESRGTLESLEGLKKLHDSFGNLMSIPCQYEKFCRTAPRLIKLPQGLAEKAKTGRELRSLLGQWLKSELTKLGAEAIMEKGKDVQPTAKEELYRFCCDVLKTDLSLETSNEVKFRSAMVTKDYVTKEKDAEFAAERAAIAAERANFQADKEAAVNAEKAETQKVRNQMEQQRIALQSEKETAVNAEKAKTEAVRNQMEQQRVALQSEKETAVNAEKAKAEAVRNQMEQQRVALQSEKETAVNAEKTETQKVRDQMEQQRKSFDGKLQAAVDLEKAETQKVRDLLNAEQTARKENEAIWSEKHRKAVEKLKNAQDREAELKRQADSLRDDLTNKNTEIETLNTRIHAKDKEVQEALKGKIQMGTLFGLKYPVMAKPVILRFAAITLALGLLLGLLVGGLVGGCGKEPEPTDTIITKPPVTDPIETQPIVTEPIETEPTVTVPPITEPKSILQEDGRIDWDYVYASIIDIDAIACEAADVEVLLAELALTAEGYPQELEAVLTVAGSGSEQPVFLTVSQTREEDVPAQEDEDTRNTGNSDKTANVDNTADSGEPADEANTDASPLTVDEETTPVLTALSDLMPAMVLDNGSYHIEVFYSLDDSVRSVRNTALDVAQQLFREITADDAAVSITTVVSGEVTVDLNGLMSEVSGNGLWWKNGYKLELRENKLAEKKTSLDTSKTPIVVILFDDGSEAVVYNYADNTKKRSAMVSVLGKRGYDSAYNDTLVIGLKPVEQEVPAESTEALAESTEAGETA